MNNIDSNAWIFSRRTDFLVFSGPVLLAILAIVVFYLQSGKQLPHMDVPWWGWLIFIGLVDGPHVYSTLYRTYFDREEFARRKLTYIFVPLLLLAVGIGLHLQSSLHFWRFAAYFAIFHFVRQQYGWMAYSARKGGQSNPRDFLFDKIMIYNATLFPLIWRTTHPVSYGWFTSGDVIQFPLEWLGMAAMFVHWVINILYCFRLFDLYRSGTGINVSKLQVIFTTWIAWYGGFVLLNSQFATVAFIALAHGIPYMVIIHRYGKSRFSETGGVLGAIFKRKMVILFYGLIFLVALVESGVWGIITPNEVIPHNYQILFGPLALAVIIPILELPGLSHYAFDTFLWKTGDSNPDLREHLSLT